MRWGRRRDAAGGGQAPLLSVVVPVYDVEAYLPACLDSVLASTYPALEVVVVDDGSPDASAAIAADYERRDPRVRLVRQSNAGLGAARNTGIAHARGALLGFADSDDVVPAHAYTTLARALQRSGADLVTGSIARWYPADAPDGRDRLVEPPWMRRTHQGRPRTIEDEPELLGDVFAWNKLYRRDFWDAAGLSWLEGRRYEDQPTTTEGFLAARRLAVVPDVVYHWRTRTDGTSITQQRGSLTDLVDRWHTKRLAIASVARHGSPAVSRVFHEVVLPGDLGRYFEQIPDLPPTPEAAAWWELLVTGVRELFGVEGVLASHLAPVHRLTGWLVVQDRRDDAALVQRHAADLPPGTRPRRVPDGAGGLRLEIPGLDPATVEPAALAVRPHEA